MCGEKFHSISVFSGHPGSPPRVRGKERKDFFAKSLNGITPACAGKSRRSSSAVFVSGDHPRVCGEKVRVFTGFHVFQGSPPRVRGKDPLSHGKLDSLRITPACAGKRSEAGKRLLALKDHPRVCGEKPRRKRQAPRSLGSPPRVRGKGKPLHHCIKESGITPACAGKSLTL